MNPRIRRPSWRVALALAPVTVVWVALVASLAYLLLGQADATGRADENTVREWLEEARVFRKTLPDLAAEYATLSAEGHPAEELRAEILEQLGALAEPTRAYLNQLPGLPVVYRLSVSVPGAEPIEWRSPLPRPREQNRSRVRTLALTPRPDATPFRIECDYQMHAFSRLQADEAARRRLAFAAMGLLAGGSLVAGLGVTGIVQRERRRDLAQLEAQSQADAAERELLEERLAAAQLRLRADEAEREALQMRSQLYASISVMAGSYAHNIKNLLVRPNDLLSRCLESRAVPGEQAAMIQEVRGTLGTVTERLQQILRTVRRDPTRSELSTVDLAELARETGQAWGEMAREKWKVALTVSAPPGKLVVRGDLSHLQQALENLLFNARDATFEMRGILREQARTAPPAERRERLIQAAGWRGEVAVSVQKLPDGGAALSVTDNGIGMTDEVRANCLTTHFTTKQGNALFEGYNAGTGLGLSFVAVVLGHHEAKLEIVSEPLNGATFRVTFPPVSG